MSDAAPSIVVLGGPNGAGKTTVSKKAISGVLNVAQFVNADVIATGLSGFNPEAVALQAGRVMLARLHELAAEKSSFAFETTLASRTFAPWLRGRMEEGYQVHLMFVWLRSPEMAIERVRARISKGGHSVPEDVIRRRYYRGIANFTHLYSPFVTEWRVYDNSGPRPRFVAMGGAGRVLKVGVPSIWRSIREIPEKPREDDL